MVRPLLILLCLSVPSLAGQPVDPGGWSERWAKAWSAKDLDATLALYAPTAVFLPPGGGRTVGTASLRELFRQVLATSSPSITLHSRAHAQSGVLAYDEGDYDETIVSASGKRHLHGSYLNVFQQQPDGRWLIVEQMWTEAAR